MHHLPQPGTRKKKSIQSSLFDLTLMRSYNKKMRITGDQYKVFGQPDEPQFESASEPNNRAT